MAFTATGSTGFYFEYATSSAIVDSNSDAASLLYDGTHEASNTTGHIDTIALPAGASGDDFAVRYTGIVTIPEAGDWDFQQDADDGFLLYIDGVLITKRFVDQIGAPLDSSWNSGNATTNLTAGTHEFEIVFWEHNGGQNVFFRAQGPSDTGYTDVGAPGGLAVLGAAGPAPVNAAPTFTSGTTASVAEGADVAYDATATDDSDSEGSGITYSLAGSGVDNGDFTINSATGVVSFASTPDFEAAADTGANNEYNITVRATDNAGAFTDQAVAITVTNVAPNSANVTVEPGSAAYAEGTTIEFTVTFDENVTGTGAALTLTGGRSAAQTGGNGTQSLTFDYTVQAGDNESDLEVTGYTGTIQDAGGADAVLTPTTNLNIVLDTTAPATPGTPDLVAASDTNIDNDNITFDPVPSFAVDVSMLDAGDRVVLVDTSNSNATMAPEYDVTGSEAGGIATIVANNITADGVYTVAAIAVDPANNISATSSSLSVTFDSDADLNNDATIAFVNAGADMVYGGSEVVSVSVTGLDTGSTGSLTITGTSGSVMKSVTANGTVALSQAESVSLGDGALSASMSITDVAGNTASAPMINSFSADYTSPMANTAVFSAGSGTAGAINESDVGMGTVTLAITFNEPMDTAVVPTVTIDTAGTGLSESATVARTWNSPTNTVLTLTYDLSDENADLSGVNVSVAGAQDAAGNMMVLGATLASGAVIDTEASADQTASYTPDEITDQEQGTAGAITLATLDGTAGTDGTTYAVGTTTPVDAATHVEFNGLVLQIKDNTAARSFFDAEVNPSVTINVVGTDNAGNTTTSPLTFALQDLNDAPQQGTGAYAGAIKERADVLTPDDTTENAVPFGIDGTFTVTDDDTADTHSVTVSNISSTAPGGAFLGFFQAGFDDPITGDGEGTVAWDFNVGLPFPPEISGPQMATIDALAEGETIVQEYDVVITETGNSPNLTRTERVVITIEGTNDAPVISDSAVTGAATEVADPSMDDQTLTAEGTLNVVDTDITDTVVVDVTSVVASGTGAVNNPLTSTQLEAFMSVVAGDGDTGTTADSTAAMAANADPDPQLSGSDFTWKFSAGSMTTGAFDFLNAGDELVLTYTLTATDDNAPMTADMTGTQEVTITITGSNDVPTISTASTAMGVVEAGVTALNAPSAGNDDINGTLNSLGNWADADDGETAALMVVDGSAGVGTAQAELTFDSGPMSDEAAIEGTYGTLYLKADGTYRYELDNTDEDTQALDGGDNVTETFNYTIANRDGSAGNTASSTLTVEIAGTNDAPVLTFATGADMGAVTEAGVDALNAIAAGTASATGTFAATDVDADDTTLTWTANPAVTQAAGANAAEIAGIYGTFSVTSAGVWSFDLGNGTPAVQSLYQGESVSESFEVQVSDGNGGFDTQSVTINITGTNDAPTVSVAAGMVDNDVIEAGDDGAGDTVASGAFDVSDDDDDAPTTDDDAKIWSIISNNDGAVTPAVAGGAAAEVTGTYGTLSLTSAGGWTYALNNMDADTQALDDGSAVTDVFTVRVADGLGGFDDINVTVNVAGDNDAPVITVDTLAGDGDTAALTEDVATTLTATDTLTISDVDANEVVSTTVTGLTVSGVTGAYGADTTPLDTLLSITDGTLTNTTTGGSNQATWTFSGASTLFDYLAEGEVLTLAYEVTSNDTTSTDTQTVTVTVTGTNDTPAVSVESGDSAAGSVTESTALVGGTQLQTDGTLTISDLDATDTHTPAATLATATWTDLNGADNMGTSSAAGTISAGLMTTLGAAFSVSNTSNDVIDWDFDLADTEVDFLGAGEELVLVFNVTAQDDSTIAASDTSAAQTVTITIVGTDDAPTLTAGTTSNFGEGNSNVIVDGAVTGPAPADEVTVNLLGTGTNDADNVWVTTVVEELDTNDVRTILGTPSIASVTGTIPSGYTSAMVEAAFGGLSDTSAAVTFDRNAEVFDALDTGAFIDVTLNYTVRTTSPDGTTVVDTPLSTVVRVNGANDAPYITDGEALDADITEDDVITVGGNIYFNDIEPTDIADLTVTTTATQSMATGAADLANYVGNFSAGFANPTSSNDGLLFYSFNVANSVINNLAEGEVFTQSYKIAITDNGGLETTDDIVITFTGANDAPTNIAVTGATVLTEDMGTIATDATSDQQLTGTVTFDDADISDLAAGDAAVGANTHTITSAFKSATLDTVEQMGYAGATGDFEITAASIAAANAASTVGNAVDWTFDIDDADFDHLAAGEVLALTYTVTIDDGYTDEPVTQDITLSITGTNDSPTLTQETGDAVTGGVTETGAALTTSGTLTLADADLSDVVTVSATAVSVTSGDDNSIANATLLAMMGVTDTLNGSETSEQVTWNFNSAGEGFDHLPAGDTLVLTYTLTATDDASPAATTTQDVVITITGANNTPTIAGTTADSVAEDAMDLTASGTLTISDTDTGESSFQAIVANTAGDNAYGTFEVGTNGVWTYTLNNTSPAVQDLAVGASLTDTITVTSFDGTATQELTVTINGTNDDPVINEGTSDNAPTTDEDTAVTGSIIATDRDLDDMGDGDTLSYSVTTDGTNGSASVDANGDYTYTPDLNFNGSDSFVVTVTDGKGGSDTVTVNVTIDPVNDAPVGNDVPAGVFNNVDEDEMFTRTVVAGPTFVDGTEVPLNLFATDVEGNIDRSSLAVTTVTIGGVPAADLATAGVDYNSTTGLFSFDGTVDAYQSLAEGTQTTVVINFTVTDTDNAVGNGTLTLTMDGLNDAPVLVAASSTLSPMGAEDAPSITGTILATDVDAGDTPAYTVEAGDSPANGTVTIDETTGAYSYVPGANFNGTDAFTVTITDDENAAITTVVNVTVAAVNDATEIETSAQVTPTHVEAVDAATPVATAITDAVTLVDVDALDYDTAVFTAAVTGGDASDVLSLGTAGGVSVSGTSVSVGGSVVGSLTTGTAALSVTFAGIVSEAQVQAVVQALTYATTSDQPAASRTITLDLTDGDGGTAMQQPVSVDITASNDTPVAADFTLASVNEDTTTSTTIVVGAASTGEVSLADFGSDPDGNIDVSSVSFPGTVTAGGMASDFTTLGLSYNAMTGVISVDTSVAFYQSLDAMDPLELLIDFTLTDDASASDTGVMTVNVTGVNDQPTLTAINLETYADTAANNSFTDATGTLVGADADADDTVLTYTLDAGTAGTDIGGSFTTQASGYGTLKLYDNGSYSFDVDAAAVNAAPSGSDIVVNFGVVVSDGNGAANSDSVVTNVSITIAPANDTPEIDPILAASITDTVAAGTFMDITGTATATDRDSDDTPEFSISGQTVAAGETSETFYYDRVGDTVVTTAAAGLIELGTLTVTTAGGYTFDVNDAGINALRDGETPAISTMLRATDDEGLFTETALNINVTGVNDAPVVEGIVPGATITAKEQLEASGMRASAEGDAVTTAATISYSDVDSTSTPNFAFIPAASGYAGTISFTPSGGTVADGNVIVSFAIPDAELNALAEGQALDTSPQQYEIRIFDEAGSFVSQTVFIEIVGSNDRPVITAAAGQEGAMVSEAADGAMDSTITANGTLGVTDEDTTDDVTLSVTDVAVSGTYAGTSTPSTTALEAMLGFAAGAGVTTGFTPTLTLAADGMNTDASWGFTSGSAGDNAFEFLAAGETLVLAYEVTADDSSGTDTATATQTVTITITGTNDGPVAAGDVIENVAEDFDIGAMTPTVIATASSTDSDDSDVPVYSIQSGNDAGLFAIDSATGDITLAAGMSLDAETSLQHVLTIEVDDQNGGTDTQQITINVSDVDDNITTTPVDTDTAFFGAGNVNENAANGTEVGITALSSDADATANPLVYSIAGGTGMGLFTINSATGVVTVDGSINREAAGGDSYTLEVEATPQNGAASTAATFTITVNDDITEFSVTTPQDTDANANSLAENSAGGAIVGITAMSTDDDATFNTVTYALTDSAGGRFEIDTTSGVVTLSDEAGAPALNFETDASHNITIEATSADGTTASNTFTIAVTDADDTPPVITSANTANADENQTAVLTLTATDVDSDASQTTYTLVGGADMGAFTITGDQLTFTTAPDFEMATDVGMDGTYEVTVQATDVLGNSSTQSIAVTVQDVNEAPDVALANGQMTVDENTLTAAGVKVADIVVSDDAMGTNALDLVGDDADDFEIRMGMSGPELFFIGTSPNFESPADDNADGIYNVTVTVDDATLGMGVDNTAAFTLSVNDVAEAPVANDNVSLSAGNVSENSTFTVTISAAAIPEPLEAALSALATDEDGDIDLTSLSFDSATLDGMSTTVTAVGVSYDSGTGVFTLAASGPSFEGLDAGATAALVVGFTVTDGTSLTDTGTLSFTIEGTNDLPVVDLVASDLDETGDEDTAITGTVVATDIDASSTLGYTIAMGDGATNGTVSIDAVSGAYTYTPDAEFNGTDSFTVTITDDQMASVTQLVELTVTPVDDAPDATTGTGSTAEDTAVMIDVTPFVTEVDGDDFTVTAASVPSAQGTVTFSGKVITFIPASNYNGAATISYTVSDATGAALNDSDTINVTITAVDDAPIAADGTATTTEDAPTSIIDVNGLITEVDGDTVIVTATVPAAQGTVTVSGTEIRFTPALDFNGTASITYTVTDDTAGMRADTGVVAVTVAAVNDATEIDATAQVTPTHVETVDSATVAPTLIADAVTLVDVDGLDYDTAVLTATVDGGDLTDILSVDTSGVVDLDGSGNLSVSGTMVGMLGLAATGSISFTFNAMAQESDVQAVLQALTYATASDQPAASRTITLDLTDGDGLSAMQQSVDVTITASNDTPTPQNDAFGAEEGSFLSTVNVKTFGTADSDPDDDTLTVTALADVKDDTGIADASGASAVGASAGVITTDWGAQVTLQSDGSLFYNLTSSSARFNQLAEGETAVDTFTYTVSDGALSETATVSVTITGTNDNIVAQSDAITATEDTAASITGNLLDNDTDRDVNDIPAIISVASSSTATALATASGYVITTNDGVVVTLAEDGSYTLTAPNSLDEGTLYSATFQYTVQDDGSQSTTTVTVDVTGNNDGPAAATVSLTASDEDTARVITSAELLTGATDPDANAMLSITDLTLTSGNGTLTPNGGGTWTYTPALNDDSAVTFSYTVSDGTLTAASSADLDLTPVNDNPVDNGSDMVVSGDEDTAITGTIVASDVDGDTLSYALDASPANGSVMVDAVSGAYTYTPDADFNGTDAFSVTVSDGAGGSTSISVAVTVDPVNDSPVDNGSDVVVSGDEDTAITGTIVASDVDGDTLSYALDASPANGSVMVDAVSGAYTYTPDADFNGTDAFSVTVSDGAGGSTSISVAVTVDPVNDSPVDNGSDVVVSGDEDTAITGTIVASDVDGDTLSYALDASPANGSVMVDAVSGAYTYTPDADFNGTDAFSVTVSDGAGGSTSISVAVTVDPVNDSPVDNGSDVVVSGDEDTAITGTIVASDVDGDTLSYALAAGGDAANGTVVVNTNGSYTYTPDADFNGSDFFVIQVSDGAGGTDTIDVYVTVDPVNDTPTVAAALAQDVAEDTGATIDLLAGAMDVEGNTLSVANMTLVSGDASGIVITGTTLSVTAEAYDSLATGESEVISYSYDIEDGNGGTVAQTLVVTVTGENDAAVIGGTISGTVEEDASATALGTLTSTDVDGTDNLFLAAMGTVSYGDFVIDTNGAWNYTLDDSNLDVNGLLTGESLNDSFTVASEDGTLQTISITINGSTDGPTESADTLVGTNMADNIDGLGGNDNLIGRDGNDTLTGGAGADTISGDDGDDMLSGGGNSDVLGGGLGNDTLDGGFGADALSGNAGDDSLTGGAANDTLSGGTDNDTLSGGDGADRLFGNLGDDLMLGDAQDDYLSGGGGNDTIRGGTGKDEIFGLNDDDYLTGGGNTDLISGGNGNDTLLGNLGNDTLDGGAGDDEAIGGDGSDVISGGFGNDSLYGLNGSDLINGDAGNDLLDGGDLNDTLFGGDGDDTLDGGNGADALDGGTGNDVLSGNTGADSLDGGIGNDTLDGGAGADTLMGGVGDDMLTGLGDADTFVFADGSGTDTVTDFSAVEMDVLDLSAVASITDMASLQASLSTSVGGHAVVSFGTDSVELQNVTVAEIGSGLAYDEDNFIFV